MRKYLVFCILILLIKNLYGQHRDNYTSSQNRVNTPVSTTVKYDDLVKIAKKYGMEKKLVWEPPANNKNLKRPDKITIKMSIEQFEEMMKQAAFNEKRVEILKQYYEIDYPKLTTVSEYLELKRSYVKKYPEYLKNERLFQEEYMREEEENAHNITLNTKGFKMKPKK